MLAVQELFVILHPTQSAEAEMEFLVTAYKEGHVYCAFDEISSYDICVCLMTHGLFVEKRHKDAVYWLGSSFTLTEKGVELVQKHLKEAVLNGEKDRD